MDNLNENRTNCSKHPENQIKFVQYKDIQNDQEKSIFYCTRCINEDLAFEGADYLLISEIMESSKTDIIQKWPPVNDQKVIDDLINVTNKASSHLSVEKFITNYFDSLKQEVVKKIDECQKRMLHHLKDLPIDGQSVLRKYQSISQIEELNSLFNHEENDSSDLKSKELKFKEFLMSVEQKKDEHTGQLQSLLKDSLNSKNFIDFEYPYVVKQSILAFVDQINFFQASFLNSNNEINQSQLPKRQNISERIVKLISNESNHCSELFLKEVQEKLIRINPILQELLSKSFEKEDELVQ